MTGQRFQYYNDRLQAENYKSFYLAFLRVAISAWFLKELCINWSSLDLLYGNSSFVVPNTNFISRLPGGFSMARSHYWWLIVPYIAVIFLNILGFGKWLTGLTLFLMVDVLQKMNTSFMNGGDKMAKLILLYLVLADSYQYFVWKKKTTSQKEVKRKFQNLLSNLAALCIMLQLCVAYFATGLAKLMDPLWLSGEAFYYALSMERFMGTPFNQYIVQYKWIDISANYLVLIFEIGFPFLVWFKKLRKPLLAMGVLFHLCIYIFLMIYGFQIVFLLMYGLFLANEKLVEGAKKLLSKLQFIAYKDNRFGLSLLRFTRLQDGSSLIE